MGFLIFYTVYKITCIGDGKIYIGKHQTMDLDDGYMGSGKLIRAAIKKHGEENFKKEILHIFETEEEMNVKEAELVEVGPHTYNLCHGGKGGWGYVNHVMSKDTRNRITKLGGKATKGKTNPTNSKNLKSAHNRGLIRYDTFTGKRHTAAAKEKMSQKASMRVGNRNSQFGTVWLTDGNVNMKVLASESNSIVGFTLGRTIRRG